jgi:hypothetical protein
MAHVFISYHRVVKEQVVKLATHLEENGLTVWYDDHINAGEFKPQIEKNIRAADVFLVLITKGAVGPTSSGWVEWEIGVARDAGITQLLPCVIGNVELPPTLASRISGLQQIRVESIPDLLWESGFKRQIALFRDYIARGGRASDMGEGVPRPVLESVPAWYAEDHPAEAHALMLSVACLEGHTPQIVFDGAESLRPYFERRLRTLTEEELGKQPRRIAAKTLSDKLAAIGAERVRLVNPVTEQRAEVIRFGDPNWRASCLTFVWREVFDVRDALLDWVDALFTTHQTTPFAQKIALSLGIVAQIDMVGVRQRVLNRWLAPPCDWDKVDVAASILAIAAEDRGNIQSIRDLLMSLLSYRGLPDQEDQARRIALRLALGPLGLRRPELAMEVLRKLGRETFFHDARLRRHFEHSQAIGGYSNADDGQQGAFVPEQDADTPGETLEEPAQGAGEARPEDATPRSEDGETSEPGPSATKDEASFGGGSGRQAVAVAGVLAALGDWIDEKLPEERLHERQVPLAGLLLALGRMPLETPDATGRPDATIPVSLADLVWRIRPRDPDLYKRIERGLVRAAKARRLSRYRYLPKRHLQHVCQAFARERHEARRAGTPGAQDTFLVFAQSLYGAIAEAGGDPEFAIVQTSTRFLTDEDREAIRAGPASTARREAAET